MMSARRVSSTIGTSANGMPNESTTCEMTSVVDGSTPIASTTSDGAIVIARRRNRWMRRLMKPCITTWPANVPTLEELEAGREQRDRERERRAAAEQRLEAGVRALDRRPRR